MSTLVRRAPASRIHSSYAARLGVVVVIAMFLARVAFVPAPVIGASSPLGDSAAAWPSGWSSYNFATGSPVIDVENEPGISPDNTDLASNNGVVATPLMSFDGTTAFFRLRLKGDPRDGAKGGFDNATWLLQIATATDDVVRAVVGVNGKPVNTDFVYVANAPGTAVTNVYETPFDNSGGQLSAGARGVPDGAGQYYLDFQVPISRITAASGGIITATTPVKLFYGSSAAANLAVINKDYMTGSSVSFTGLATITVGPAHLAVSKTRTTFSGPHPPEVGETTIYDLTLSVRNDGGNAATSVVATDTIPAGVTIESLSTATGSISRSGQAVTWNVGSLPAGGPAVTATIRVSVSPLNADWNTTLSLNPGASFSATDAGVGGSVAASTGSVAAGPVGGNRFPDAVDDSATATDDAAVTVNVLANDSDPDGSLVPSSMNITGAATKGSTSVDGTTGAITYTPNPDATGTDDFEYRVCDSGSPSRCDIAMVTITLRHTPVAGDDSATLAEDGSTIVNVVANDTDVDGNLDPTTVSVQSGPSHGTTSVNGTTGAITYTPAANHNGPDSLTYEICDSSGLCDTATVSFTVTAVNDAPVASDDSATLAEDGSTIVDVVANDTDIDGHLLASTVFVTADPANGSVSVNGTTGAITYTPFANYSGSDSLTYRVCDSSGACDAATVSFTVTAVNDAPMAVDDSAILAQNGSATVDVVANDTDVDGNLDATTVRVMSGPTHGIASVNPVTGAITYTPTPGYAGSDSLTYEVCDTTAVCDTATVSFTVTMLNDAPVAVDDSTTLAEDGSTIVDVVSNDTDVDGNLDPTTVDVLTGPSHGTASVNGMTGAITYAPAADYNGADSLTYEICDLGPLCDTATVTFTVTAVNDAPVANDDAATTNEDSAVTVDVVANDTDVDANLDATTVVVTGDPSTGAASVNGTTGAITYTPSANYNGADSLAYRICDSSGACDTATVSFTVTAVNDAPVANDDSATTNEDSAVTVDVVANDTDIDGNLLASTVSVTADPSNGTASVNGTTGAITYTPAANHHGTDSLTYRICDSSGACDTAAVSFTVAAVNDAPVANDDTAGTDEETAVAIDVVANDTDIDDGLDPASVSVESGPGHGTASVNGTTGAITYTPDANYNGADSLTYEICDLAGLCDTATVSITVGGLNDAPVANDDSATTKEDTAVIVDVVANDTDVDGNLDSTSVSVLTGPSRGIASVNPATGVITYTPAANNNGTDSLTYEICDLGPLCDTATVTFTVTAVNDAPIANDDTPTTNEDSAVTVDVAANDTDVDGDLDPTTVSIQSGPSHGTTSVNLLTGAITYAPASSYNGPDSLTYQVCDLGGLCDTATVSFTVTAVNDAPVALDDNATTDEDTSTVVDVLANDTDLEGNIDSATVNVTAGPSHGTTSVNPVTGAITYSPFADYTGPDSLSYQVCDLGGLCDTATVSFTVSAVNDAPVANDDTALLGEDASATIDVVANDTDIDGNLDAAAVSVTSGPTHGSTSVNPVTGAITYTPTADYNGTDSLTYEVCDSSGACDTATVSLTIDPVQDPPVAGDDSASTNEDAAVIVNVAANDKDAEGNLDATTVIVKSGPSHGTTSVDPATGAITYTPTTDYNGTDSLTYEICGTDALCDTATVSFTIAPLNDAPVANNDAATTNEDTEVTVDVAANDTDVDGNLDPTTVFVTVAPSHGTTSVNGATGAITYTPAADYTGADSLTYRVCDSPGACATATVSFTVTAVNDAPAANDDSATTDEDTAVIVDVVANDTDIEVNLDAATVSILSGPSHGVVSVNGATGAITYTPALNHSGADSLTYRVCDLGGLCDTATVSFTVTAVNDAPAANDDTAFLAEDTTTTTDVVANDTDVDGNLDATTVDVLTGPTHGTASVDPVTGEITYTPDPGYADTDSLTYEICDTSDLCDTATLTFDVGGVNDAPVANDDSATTNEDSAVTVDVAANDTDVDGELDATSVSVTSAPSNGTASVNTLTGAITYTPAANYNGTDSLTYEICDTSLVCDTAAVSFTVRAVNDAPVANDDSSTTDEDTAVIVSVVANDTDVDANLDPTTVFVTAGPSHGTTSVNGTTGALTYTPAANYNGADSLTYRICDASGACDTATVSFSVGAGDDAPVAVNDTDATDEDTAVTTDVLANDTDADGNLDATSVSITLGPSNGDATVDPDTGAITYTPDPDWSGSDSLSYQVCDATLLCDTATVNSTAGPVNDAPVANDDSATLVEDGSITVGVTANDTDVDGNLDPTTVTILSGPAGSIASVDLVTGEITYTPAADYNGSDSLTYEVCDTDGLCDMATVSFTVTAVNDAPVANDDSAVTDEDATVTVNVVANDTDVDGSVDPATVTVIAGPAHGTASVDTLTGAISYTPAADYDGTDSLAYQVCDDTGACDTATVTFTIDPVNDAPVARDDTASVVAGDSVVVDVLANDTDIDGPLDPASVAVTAGPAHGSVTMNAVTGEVTYSADAGFAGVDGFDYRVCDSDGRCATAMVLVSVGGAPIAVADTAATVGGEPVTIDVLANDTDPDGTLDIGTLRVTHGPAHGSVAIDPVTGVITYTPDADASRPDTFTYEICDTDPELVCSSAVVTIDVNGRPGAANDAVAVKSDGSVVIDPLANDHDLDGDLDPASVTVTDPPAHGTVTVDPLTGRITYVPDPGYSGPDSFTYRVCDTGDPVACATGRVDVAVGAPATSSAIVQLLGDTPSRLAWPVALLVGILAATWVMAGARRRRGDDTPR